MFNSKINFTKSLLFICYEVILFSRRLELFFQTLNLRVKSQTRKCDETFANFQLKHNRNS